MNPSADRIQEMREAIALWDDILTHAPGSDLAYYLVLDGARSFLDGELPPGFPTDDDVKIVTESIGRIDSRGVRLALQAIADARRVRADA